MSLTRIDTGEQPNPISEMEKRTDKYKTMTDNQLLREALAKSNEKCNNLIRTQISLIEDLTDRVNELKTNNNYNQQFLLEKMTGTINELRKIIQEERQFKTEITNLLRNEITHSANEVSAYVKTSMDVSIKDAQRALTELTREIDKQRFNLQIESGFRKFAFWITPILVTALSVFTVIMHFN